MKNDLIEGSVCIFVVALMLAAWVTHVLSCIVDATWGFLIAGAIMFPVAIVHGIYIWFT